MPESLPATVERVAEYTASRDMESEEWEKGIAILGLLATGKEYDERARELVDRSIETQTEAGQFSYGSLDTKPHQEWTDLANYQGLVDPAVIGLSVLEFYERTGMERYLSAARRQYEFIQRAPRTAEGGIPQHRGRPLELWIDTIYELCPFLARYGRLADEPDAFDEAAKQICLQSDILQDPRTDLFRHEWREKPNTFPESSFWSRGNAWVLAGIVDTLEELPDDHENREALIDVFQRHAAAVVDRQDRSGYWHNVLDDETTPLETSGSTMFAYAFKKGIQRGLLDEEPYAGAAADAMDVCQNVVDKEGAVRRVVGPPGGPDAPFAVTSYGQGWFLLAADQFE